MSAIKSIIHPITNLDTPMLLYNSNVCGNEGPILIHRQDLKSLEPGQLPNDKIINFWMSYTFTKIATKNKEANKLNNNVMVLSSHFYDSWIQYQTSSLTFTGSRNLDNIFTKSCIFIPIYKDQHWLLVLIANLTTKTPSIVILDLKPHAVNHDTIAQNLILFLEQEWSYRHGTSLPLQNIHINSPVLNQQGNHECGYYTVNIFESIVRSLSNGGWSVTQQCKVNVDSTRLEIYNTIQTLIKEADRQPQHPNKTRAEIKPRKMLIYSKEEFQQFIGKSAREDLKSKYGFCKICQQYLKKGSITYHASTHKKPVSHTCRGDGCNFARLYKPIVAKHEENCPYFIKSYLDLTKSSSDDEETSM